MMGWQLKTGTSFCEVGGELVFLDLVRDKYLALRGDDRAAFDRLRAAEPNDSDAMTRLLAAGLLARSEKITEIAPAFVDIPSDDLGALGDRDFSIGMTFASAKALRWARGAMRPNRIAQTVEALGISKRKLASAVSDPATIDIAARYASCRWINPTPPRCLVDALALDHILLARGLVTTLVFGVRLRPFAAHCWLQTPSRVLTGTAAEARNFTPILVVS